MEVKTEDVEAEFIHRFKTSVDENRPEGEIDRKHLHGAKQSEDSLFNPSPAGSFDDDSSTKRSKEREVVLALNIQTSEILGLLFMMPTLCQGLEDPI